MGNAWSPPIQKIRQLGLLQSLHVRFVLQGAHEVTVVYQKPNNSAKHHRVKLNAFGDVPNDTDLELYQKYKGRKGCLSYQIMPRKGGFTDDIVYCLGDPPIVIPK